MSTIQRVELDSTLRCADAVEFDKRMRDRVVGQDEAIDKISWKVQTFMAGLNAPGRPAGILLFLGPTGTGKTRVVEAMADVLFDNPKAFTKINCGEFQQSHEISKIIGAPPGYTGHKETKPLISQEELDKFQTEQLKLNLLLLDEIEKAGVSLYQLLLGILDKAELRLSDGRVVDLTKTLILMTSNLGATEIQKKGLGFTLSDDQHEKTDRDVLSITTKAVEKHFSSEFINRIDHIVTFKALRQEHCPSILEIELRAIRRRMLAAAKHREFSFHLKPEVADYFISKGFDRKYGARGLKRLLEHLIVDPISNFLMTGQLGLGDIVIAESMNGDEIKFTKLSGDDVARLDGDAWEAYKSVWQ